MRLQNFQDLKPIKNNSRTFWYFGYFISSILVIDAWLQNSNTRTVTITNHTVCNEKQNRTDYWILCHNNINKTPCTPCILTPTLMMKIFINIYLLNLLINLKKIQKIATLFNLCNIVMSRSHDLYFNGEREKEVLFHQK